MHDEDQHPRDPQGRWKNAPRTNAEALVSLSPSDAQEDERLRGLLAQAREILEHAETCDTRLGIVGISVTPEKLRELEFHREGNQYRRRIDGVEAPISCGSLYLLASYVNVVVSDASIDISHTLRSDGSQQVGVTTDGSEAWSFRSPHEVNTRIKFREGSVEYDRYWNGNEYSYINSRDITLRRDLSRVYRSSLHGGDETIVTQEEIDAMEPNAFQTGYDVESKVSEVQSVLWG